MATFEWIIVLLLGAALLAALARRLGAPYPTFLALGGALLAFVPASPNWTLDPQLALTLFVAPVLVDAAYDTSLRDLRANWRPIAGLVVAAVGTTVLAVALAARWLVPEMPWPVAIALGAVVAPPDAAAATAVMRQVKLPHKLLKILEGESLLNDASALLVYRLAIMAVMVGHVGFGTYAPVFLLTVFGSLAAGVACSFAIRPLMSRLHDVPISLIVQFATTFGVWIAAEAIGLSGILTLVAFAMTTARRGGPELPARMRIPIFAVWETVVFVLNAFAFVLIGMQLRPIWARLGHGRRLVDHAADGHARALRGLQPDGGRRADAPGMTSGTRTTGERVTGIVLAVLTAAVLIFLVAPILTIVPLSFSSGSFFFYPLPGLSLRWYEDFFTSAFWLPALRNSLIIGVSATVLATVLGTLAALGIWRARFPAQALVLAILISPMVVPVIIVAVGVYFAFAPLGLTDGYLGLILAHATLGVPFVVITVMATLAGFDRTLIRAAEGLGASPITTFRRVMLPLILPGVASGAVFAFAASFDEVVVALLMAGPGQRTLPRQMFAGINDNISLTIAAAATMLIVISLLLMIAVGRLQRRSARMRQSR